ncbi:cytochrome P450 [Novosphingobium taihuense]|uniref:Cytochrome P450 n=1 Tax=Novosphingobium taihuense TaxID=260085 RepID=A0A7W7EUF4_9SPHN|nr:cytochrome P450 [Novosphingobium taihuense]MBB4614297.1 cytochrome P450 [Novosphingobium taihuense]TWH87144.1 cytochrome P450 [Novosphingobium taihuense]
MATALADIPDHVPSELVRDVDIFNVNAIDPDIHIGWKKLQDASPSLIYTPRNGGHWIPMRAHVIERVFQDADVFINGGEWVPPNPKDMLPLIPIMSDGALHRAYRSFLMPYVVGKPLLAAIERARGLAIDLIEGFRADGACDFAVDFAQHLPIEVFLSLVDLPSEDRPYLASLAEVVRMPDEAERMVAFQKMYEYVAGYVDKRTKNPGNDLISTIANGSVLGRPMTREEIVGECTQVLIGGLDTVASMMGFIAAHLAVNVPLRRRLVAEPRLIERRVDEIIRRFGVAGPSRQAVADIEIDGITVKAGDTLFLATALHGLDESRWNNSLEIDLDRSSKGTDFQTFGSGPHRCPGAALARSEIILFMEEWLKRIPDYSLDPEKPMVAASGNVTGVLSLPLKWEV